MARLPSETRRLRLQHDSALAVMGYLQRRAQRHRAAAHSDDEVLWLSGVLCLDLQAHSVENGFPADVTKWRRTMHA